MLPEPTHDSYALIWLQSYLSLSCQLTICFGAQSFSLSDRLLLGGLPVR